MKCIMTRLMSAFLSMIICFFPLQGYSECIPPSYYRGGCGNSSSGCDSNWIFLGAAAVIGGVAGYLAGNHKGPRGKNFDFTKINQTFTVTFIPAAIGTGTAGVFTPFVVDPRGVQSIGTPFSLGGSPVQVTFGPPILVGLYTVGVLRTDAGGGALTPPCTCTCPCPVIEVFGEQSSGINGIQIFFVPANISSGQSYSQQFLVENI